MVFVRAWHGLQPFALPCIRRALNQQVNRYVCLNRNEKNAEANVFWCLR